MKRFAVTISARTALQVPYLAVRMPLGLFDERVVVRVFGADSPAHRVLSQGLQQLDTLAAGAFGQGDSAYDAPMAAPTQPKSQRPEKASAPAKAPVAAPAKAPVAASAKSAQSKAAPAGAAAPAKPAAPEEPRVEEQVPQEEQQEIARLTETFVAEQELAPRAGELAEDDEIRRVQAAIKAKQAVEDERGQL